MDDLDLDFAVTTMANISLTKIAFFASPIDKRSLRQIISYAKKNRKIAETQRRCCALLGSFELSPLSQLVQSFVPKFFDSCC